MNEGSLIFPVTGHGTGIFITIYYFLWNELQKERGYD